MDSRIASLSGAVAWASDSESLFVEPSGVNLRLLWLIASESGDRLDGRNRVAVEWRFSNDHVYPPAGTIVSKVILPSSAFFARLICAYVPLGRLFISPGAMDYGIASLSGVVAWASDSESLFVEPSGVL
ncbi:hypothetical protein F2Q69_00042333 [Brassica cretica]|uniref:Uncharacterized protein n=1 Tax=Brassica cretica TaxID=69181 RepID=A0A8S9NH79_BRACR|nr:hypothetical protein F2Q69_00042333 [Brassica cretica]